MAEYDILQAVQFDDGVEFVDGSDGFPAFKLSLHANVKSPYRLVLPEKLHEFAIMASIRPETRTGGYIFSVVNPLDTIVQLGIHATQPTSNDRWNISLVYTDAAHHTMSQNLATFEAPFNKKWTKFSFKVLSNKVVFYHNCIEMEAVQIRKHPSELVFDSASTLYLGQAGSILGGRFEVSGNFVIFLHFHRFKSILFPVCTMIKYLSDFVFVSLDMPRNAKERKNLKQHFFIILIKLIKNVTFLNKNKSKINYSCILRVK